MVSFFGIGFATPFIAVSNKIAGLTTSSLSSSELTAVSHSRVVNPLQCAYQM